MQQLVAKAVMPRCVAGFRGAVKQRGARWVVAR